MNGACRWAVKPHSLGVVTSPAALALGGGGNEDWGNEVVSRASLTETHSQRKLMRMGHGRAGGHAWVDGSTMGTAPNFGKVTDVMLIEPFVELSVDQRDGVGAAIIDDAAHPDERSACHDHF